MSMLQILADRPGGRLAENIVHFGRVLRASGLPVGPGRVLEAMRAVEAVGIARRDDFYWALFSVLVNRRDQRELFDQAFHIFWRNPRLLERMLSVMLPAFGAPAEREKETPRRLAEALTPGRGEDQDAPGEREIEIDASLTYSHGEVLRERDFESMSSEELAEATHVRSSHWSLIVSHASRSSVLSPSNLFGILSCYVIQDLVCFVSVPCKAQKSLLLGDKP